jgi:acyl dehydratase
MVSAVADVWSERVSVGDHFRACLVENLGRAHIAQYAGASGDFNSVHVDEVYAMSEAGRPSVIAHGMLTMGLTATFVTSIVGHGALRSFGGRFHAPVAPGDTLECVATVREIGFGETGVRRVSLRLETMSAVGVLVFSGEASACAPQR